jgi:formamidopyrimidine-DNA glycosylase
MPELPEVETIARDLAPLITGRTIVRTRHAHDPPVFDKRSLTPRLLHGRTVTQVARAGKYLVLDVGDDLHVAVHLRMTGNLLFRPNGEPVARTRAQFEFNDGSRLVFADVRKFGRMRVFRGDARTALGIGVDPLDAKLNDHIFGALAQGRTTFVKVWLLDQKCLAGVGNIYACESLYFAGIRPNVRVGKLTRPRLRRLLANLRRVLRKAITHRGSSVDDYVDAEGKEGKFQKHLQVYGRAGLPCRRCGTLIRRIVLGQRGTYYCPVCQR